MFCHYVNFSLNKLQQNHVHEDPKDSHTIKTDFKRHLHIICHCVYN